MRVPRDFAERVEIMVNATKLKQTQQKELNDKLIAAAIKGDIKNIRELLANGANVDAKSKYGETALFWAACSGKVDIATFLIEKGADVDAKDKNNETAVEVAIRCDRHQIAELIENSKKICSNNVDPEKETKIDGKNIDILSMDMNELVRMADESAKRLCRKD